MDGPGAIRSTPREDQGPLRCAWCHDAVGGRAALACRGCGTQLHVECAPAVCPTLGCGQALSRPPAGHGLEGWRRRFERAASPRVRRLVRQGLGLLAAVLLPLGLFWLNEGVGHLLAPQWKREPFWSWLHQAHHPHVQRWTYPLLAWSLAAYLGWLSGRRGRWVEVGLGGGTLLAGLYALLYGSVLHEVPPLRRVPEALLMVAVIAGGPLLALAAYALAWRGYRAAGRARAAEKDAPEERDPAALWGVWTALLGGGALGALRTMNELWAALPAEPPQKCFLASAAARGDPRLTGARLVRFADGRVAPVTWQLRTCKAGELLLRAACPRLHALLRAVYDRVGPPLAARLEPRAATLAWIALLPAQAAARLALACVFRDAGGLIARTYPPDEAAP